MSRIKAKIGSLGKAKKLLADIRAKNEFDLELKQLAPDGKIAKSDLLSAKHDIECGSDAFPKVKDLDAANEMNPLRQKTASMASTFKGSEL